MCSVSLVVSIVLKYVHKFKHKVPFWVKNLTEKKREYLFGLIKKQAVSYAIARASVAEIDQLNILNASLLAMKRAVEGLPIQPEHVLVDGNKIPRWGYSAESVVKGDKRVPAISAASILAKVTRDRDMMVLDKQYPGYGLAQHKGYPTKAHREALKRLGVTPIHRRSYKPVREALCFYTENFSSITPASK